MVVLFSSRLGSMLKRAALSSVVLVGAIGAGAACSSATPSTSSATEVSPQSTGGEHNATASSATDGAVEAATGDGQVVVPADAASSQADAGTIDAAATSPDASSSQSPGDAGGSHEHALHATGPHTAAPREGSTATSATTTTATATTTSTSPAGRSLFNRACGRCHPSGEADIGPRLTGIHWDEARVRRQIRAGGGTMRPIAPSRLPDGDMPALLAYLRSIGAVR